MGSTKTVRPCDVVWCEDLPALYPDTFSADGFGVVGCCESCHEDWEVECGHDPIERELPDGRVAWVCCRVAGTLDEASA